MARNLPFYPLDSVVTAGTISNGGRTFYAGASNGWAYCKNPAMGKRRGKWYFEAEMYAPTSGDYGGAIGIVVPSGAALSEYRGGYTGTTWTIAGYSGGSFVYDSVVWAGPVSITYRATLGLFVDVDTGTFGIVAPGATGPVYLGLSGFSPYVPGYTWYPAVADVGSTCASEMTINLGDRPFKYTMPDAGFKPWCCSEGNTKTTIYLPKSYRKL